MVGREQFICEEMDNGIAVLGPRKKGVYVSRLAVGVYVLVTLCLAAAVGVIVYFGDRSSSDGGTVDGSSAASPTMADDHLWTICLNMSISRNETLPCACSTTKPEPSSPNYLLPSTFRPRHYKIDIKPDIYVSNPAKFSYQGNVVMYLECTETSDVIVVHIRKITIQEPVEVISADVSIKVINTTSDKVTEFYKIYLDRQIAVGENVSVSINYHGDIDPDLVGMYYSPYIEGNQTKYMLATQFEATDARKAFPCLDEPSLKATFELVLWRKEPMIALANTPLERSENKSDGWIKDYFAITPVVMPTYLVAFAVADYKHIEKRTTTGLTEKLLRHWSRPDFIEKGYLNYSLDISLKIFDYFENYFDFPYALPKEDQISVPDSASKAMENWGLVTYIEERLVYDPNHVTLYELQRMTGTLAHELLHQWLGNVVTCVWWSDLWLNEGMARYHEYLAMQAVQPDWDVDQIFAAQVTYIAFSTDQLGFSHPLHNPVEKPIEIERMFSSITYDKAGCIIRMISELVLKDSYQEAMKLYLRQNAYDSASFVELLGAWKEQAKRDELDVNIDMMMGTWITQMGFPLVTMERVNDNTIKITQKIFRQNPYTPLYEPYPSPFNYEWEIPVTYITSRNRSSVNMEWLHRGNKTIKLQQSLTSTDWLLGNYLQYGFYRVNYDVVNWNLLINQLKADHQVFHVVNRGQLVHDSFNLGRSGDLDHVIHLRVTEYLTNERDYLPWFAAAEEAFTYFQKIFRYSPQFPVFRTYVKNLMLNNYKSLGWKKRPEDTHHDVYLRELTTRYSCAYDNTDCVETALDYFRRWKQDPSNTTIIDPDIRNAVYCTAIRYGLPSDWDFLFDVYKNFRHFSNEKNRQRMALTCSSNRVTLSRLFQMALSKDDEIMSHDPGAPHAIMRYIAQSSIGQHIAWQALYTQWDSMPSKYPILAAICESMSTEYDLEQFDALVNKHPPQEENEMNNIEDARNLILHNIRWRSTNEEAVFTWLRNNNEKHQFRYILTNN